MVMWYGGMVIRCHGDDMVPWWYGAMVVWWYSAMVVW